MASWVLIPCLKQLFAEFDAIAPNRDTASDGSIGDQAHADRVSDHNPDETGAVPIHDADHVNEVHAIDVDTNLNESDLTMEKCVQHLLARCRRGNSDPLNEARLRYIIFNRRIWRAPGWAQEVYTLDDPHTGHAHFSAEYVTALEASTASWRLEEIPVALSAADKAWFSSEIAERIAAAVPRIADGVAPEVYQYARQQTKPNMSDTAKNLIEAEITEAILDGVAVARFPANVQQP